MRVVVVVDYTNSDDVGKQNSNGRIEDNKILVEFIVLYMSVWLPLWFVAGRDDIMSHYGLPVMDDVHMAALSVAVTIYVNPVS